MKLSVVIVNYNVQYFLEQALYSVRRSAKYMQQAEPGFDTEVFVVDNNSVDGSVNMVQNNFPDVKLIKNKDNKGFSAANNQAINQATGEYVLLLNPDTIVEEDTFLKSIRFMDQHPEAGGLGVKMLDGNGEYLPESKRGFPSPSVAFFKIFGLAALFPKSKIFGKYHLGFLDPDETHKVDVLAGAFMLLRSETLKKTGLLDETFFMYGEDIDLSYRIKQAGYENYYFPDTRIIHYKGESTKKSSVSYVFTFYKAMIIFARKHLRGKSAHLFSFLIKLAIYFRAGLSILRRFFSKLALPFLDFTLLLGAMYLLKSYWESTIKYIEGDVYPPELMLYIIPSYILIWMLTQYMAKGYQTPYSIGRILTGVFWGTITIAVIYAFVPESLRFSRALIILGAILAAVIFTLNRFLFHYVQEGNFNLGSRSERRLIIIGKAPEAERVLEILNKSRLKFNFTGFVTPDANSSVAENTNFIGSLNNLNEIVTIYRVNDVVFCSKDLLSTEVINWMTRLKDKNIQFKTVPEESIYAIGSSSKNHPGDFYTVELNLSIKEPANRLNKRLLDIFASVFFLILFPILIFINKKPLKLFSNILKVLSGRYSWVGSISDRPDIMKPGIFTPSFKLNGAADKLTRERLHFLYARDYNLNYDLNILLENLRNLDDSHQEAGS